ncbi:MAG: hypothetical protein H6745_27050 [Deltaproteobacteria bacterium]|nr:hypothetical protein [Deltaproteobacteria bacterium]
MNGHLSSLPVAPVLAGRPAPRGVGQVAAALSVAFALAACASTTPSTPVEVVEAQVLAAREGDQRAAWELLTPEARAVAPHAAPPSVLPPPGTAVETERVARWQGGPEGGIELVRGAAGWQVRAGVLGLMRAETPEAALLAFARAVGSRDFDALVGLIPAASRARWTPASLARALDETGSWPSWVALAEAIRAGSGGISARTGDHGVAIFGETTVTLVREGQAWKVFDLAPASVYIRGGEATRRE